MDGMKFIEQCQSFVRDAWHWRDINIFVVWSCKTIQNNKAILATIVDGRSYFYEFTYNGNERVIYMDTYSKIYHAEIKQEGE